MNESIHKEGELAGRWTHLDMNASNFQSRDTEVAYILASVSVGSTLDSRAAVESDEK